MRSSRMWMRSSGVVRASGCHWLSRNSPRIDPPLPTENAAGCANHNVRTVALDDGLVLGNGKTTEEYANLQK
jgi:hypothetical protein